jgi:hypothetical protein
VKGLIQCVGITLNRTRLETRGRFGWRCISNRGELYHYHLCAGHLNTLSSGPSHVDSDQWVCCSDVLLVKYLLSQPSITSAFVIVESKGSPPIVLYWVACCLLDSGALVLQRFHCKSSSSSFWCSSAVMN